MTKKPLFCIGEKEFTNFIVVPSYKVNRNDQYLSWTDANHIQHRHKTRTKVSGSFSMLFNDVDSFCKFLETVETSKNQALYIPDCSVYCNNIDQVQNVNLFISYDVSDYIPLFGTGENQSFEVTIEER